MNTPPLHYRCCGCFPSPVETTGYVASLPPAPAVMTDTTPPTADMFRTVQPPERQEGSAPQAAPQAAPARTPPDMAIGGYGRNLDPYYGPDYRLECQCLDSMIQSCVRGCEAVKDCASCCSFDSLCQAACDGCGDFCKCIGDCLGGCCECVAGCCEGLGSLNF